MLNFCFFKIKKIFRCNKGFDKKKVGIGKIFNEMSFWSV